MKFKVVQDESEKIYPERLAREKNRILQYVDDPHIRKKVEADYARHLEKWLTYKRIIFITFGVLPIIAVVIYFLVIAITNNWL
ncbi:MAG: hypothetical protein JXB38_06555 [Anaerolineales bacterium]|nr:hypothetical protein [Anaerolineales bacterium]